MALIDDLVAFYEFENNALDSTPNNNDGTASGDLTYATGKLGQGIVDGGATTGRVAPPAIALGTSWSIEAWVKVSSGPGYGCICTKDANLGLFVSSTKFNFYSAADYLTTATWVSGVMTQVVYTYDGTTLRSYVNGAADTNWTVSIPAFTANSFLRDAGGYPLGGTLDEIGLWTRPISALEVAERYNGGAGLSYAAMLPEVVMPKLALHGINLGSIMAANAEPKITVRDIGDTSVAVDGTSRLTRSATKYDTTFKSIPLTRTDANAWRSLIRGEGDCWSFDANLYSGKGQGPSASTNVTQSAGSAKYGAGKLSVGATTGTVTYPSAVNAFGLNTLWTVGVWRFESAAWHHYVVRSDGTKWLDGVVDGAAVTTWLTVGSGNVTIANATGSPVLYDDLVVLPFEVLDAWPAQWFAAGVAFGAPPVLPLTGDLVHEQASRAVIGKAESSGVIKTGDGIRVSLDVELRAQ